MQISPGNRIKWISKSKDFKSPQENEQNGSKWKLEIFCIKWLKIEFTPIKIAASGKKTAFCKEKRKID